MRLLLAKILMVLLSLSLVASTTTYATEPPSKGLIESTSCLDLEVAFALGHFDGDSDQVPSDTTKGYPHHHGGSHDHQLGQPARETVASSVYLQLSRLEIGESIGQPAADLDPAHRPPIT